MRSRTWACVFTALTIATGCGGDDPVAPPVQDVYGQWTAVEFKYQSVPPETTVDIVAFGGTATLDLQEDGDFELVVSPVGELSATTYGYWELSQDMMSLTPQGMHFSWEFDVALVDGKLSLRGASVEFDFDNDEVPEDATLDMLLSK
ncbi:MAG: hypothetical protein C0395_10120 [Gemmatimonas sp.]|nr:hypothetical protein [Gemmatimonas sp.]